MPKEFPKLRITKRGVIFGSVNKHKGHSFSD